jgi:serine/threonine protein kinase
MATAGPSVDEIFDEAVRRAPGTERAAYVDEACGGNLKLKERVQQLLQAFADAGSFLESPAADGAATADSPSLSECPGTVIGPYKLLQQIGEGGFGVVFLADQERPVRRKVALKVIKPGMDTRQVIARFEAERQALALMDHPNIAKVYDAGATGNGRPYFVMELVQGVPITAYCDRCNLTTRERLELFITVCQAVQHAHQKGVIHRDIKPSNVLVAIQDGRPTPKIIDFGVAKAINQQLTEHTLMTAFAQMVGTPLYMSPEQAELSPLGVDTRSDIYSLGVLLYELLTGTTPFDKDRLHAASYDELRRIIREEEPPRPSTRISTLAADSATTAAVHRRTDARRLQQTVRGELDWIVMKCLEKDRNRRYETPNSLARDIERYLRDESVQACPPSVGYRLKKFARRNKAAAAFVGLLLASVTALGFSNIALKHERDAKGTALTQANIESARAQAVSDLLQEMLASSNPDEVKGSHYTVRELLDDFSARLGDQLADQPTVEADIRSVIGRSYWRQGVPDRAEIHLQKALDLRRREFGAGDERVADSLVDYAWNLAEQIRHAEAEKCVREALSIYTQRKSDPHRVVRAYWSLQRFLISQSRLAEAEQAANDALALTGNSKDSNYAELPNILHGLADAKSQQGKHAEAEKWAQQAVDLHRRLHGDHHPETAWGLLTLGRAFKGQRKFAEAAAALQEAMAIFREHYSQEHESVRSVITDLSSVLQAQGDRAGLEALEKQKTDHEVLSDAPGYYRRLAGLLLANKPTDAQKLEAHALIQRAIEGYGKVGVDFPGDLERRLKAAEGFVEVTKICSPHPDFAQEVNEAHRRLSAELAALLVRFPDSVRCQESVAHRYRLWAFAVEMNSSYLSQAERAHREALKLFEKLSNTEANTPKFRFFLADTCVQLGDVVRRSGTPQEATAHFQRAMEIYDQHAAEFAKDSAERAWEMTSHYFRFAPQLSGNEKSTDAKNDKAHRFIRRVIDEYDRLPVDYPGDFNQRRNGLEGYVRAIGHCAAEPGFAAEVDELNRRLEAELPKFVADFPDSSDCQWHAALLYRHWAVQLLLYSDYFSTAQRALHESIKFHEKLTQSDSTRPGVWLYLADRNIVLGYVNWLRERPEEAEAAYRRAIEIYDQHEAEEVAADTSSNVDSVINIDSVWLAYYLGCTDRDGKAAEFIRKAARSARRLTAPVDSAHALYWTALVQARLGDDAGYRETCKALVDVPVASADDSTKLITIITWCHAPAAIDDLSLPVKRAEELAAHNSFDWPHIVPYTLGAALYRDGQYERAAVELEKSIAAYPSDPQIGARTVNWQRLFLAMTKWQLGKREEAQLLLAAIQPAIDEELRSLATPFNFRLTLEVLRREAEALIGQEADDAVENVAPNQSAPTTNSRQNATRE